LSLNETLYNLLILPVESPQDSKHYAQVRAAFLTRRHQFCPISGSQQNRQALQSSGKNFMAHQSAGMLMVVFTNAFVRMRFNFYTRIVPRRTQVFARSGQWGELTRLANEKRSPIGYKPFALACLQYRQPGSELEKYIEKITPVAERIAYNTECIDLPVQ
jgi:hypothetical protein